MQPIVLTIAGIDPSGGAGVLADVRTIEALGCRATAVVTAVTAQDTRGVNGVWPLDAAPIRGQLDTLLADLRPASVKSGMLGSEAAVVQLAEALEAYPDLPYVLDPVFVSSSGRRLLPATALRRWSDRLMPRATVVTPNALEVGRLAGLAVHTLEDAGLAAQRLLERGARAVLVTGGHLAGPGSSDLLVTRRTRRVLTGERVEGDGAHGTGCVHSAALAAYLALGCDLDEAAARAGGLMAPAIRHAVRIGHGRPAADPAYRRQSGRCDGEARDAVSGIHVITDTVLQDRRSHADLAALAARGGADVIQFREKRPLETATLVEQARAVVEAAASTPARVLVNDRADVALAAGAGGVHLGPGDLDPAAARRLLGPEAIIGATANDLEQALALRRAPVDYLGVGPVFGTTSKERPAPELGLPALERIAREVAPRPVVAIGNITPDRVEAVLRAGACGVAVLSGVIGSADPAGAVARFREAFDAAVRPVAT